MLNTQSAELAKATSRTIDSCQVCDSSELESILFLGYLPLVNAMRPIGARPVEERAYPAELLYCPRCYLVQLSCIVDPKVIFPASYPYTSSTTKILRDNFAELYRECKSMIGLRSSDLIVDIGSNDGNLLSNFKDGHRVLGITPEEIGRIAIERGINTIIDYFTPDLAQKIALEHGPARVVTATNVFAHIDNVHDILDGILTLLSNDGIFISESHYLASLFETLQYDTIYHEHLRYYSLHSLKNLLSPHGLEIFHVKRIPTHGGSIRVYAAPVGTCPVRDRVEPLLREEEATVLSREAFRRFRERVIASKLELLSLLHGIKKEKKRIFGVSAPSRASTLISYVGLNDAILDCVVEIKGSHKIGNYVPGTVIPVIEESILFERQPEYALLLSWHITEELAPKLKQKGFRGDFIVPLPSPYILRGAEV